MGGRLSQREKAQKRRKQGLKTRVDSSLVQLHYVVQIKGLTIFYGKMEARGKRPPKRYSKNPLE